MHVLETLDSRRRTIRGRNIYLNFFSRTLKNRQPRKLHCTCLYCKQGYFNWMRLTLSRLITWSYTTTTFSLKLAVEQRRFPAKMTLVQFTRAHYLIRPRWTYATGRKRKEDGKPCVTNVTILLEKTFRQISPSDKQTFLKEQKTLMLSEG